MDKLIQIIQKCNCGVYLTINAHKDYDQSIDEYFQSGIIQSDDLEDIDENIYNKIKESDSLIELHFYPDTDIGSYRLYHYDLNLILDEALNILNQ